MEAGPKLAQAPAMTNKLSNAPHSWAVAAVSATFLACVAAPATSQEVPEFGSSSASAVLVDAAPRASAREGSGEATASQADEGKIGTLATAGRPRPEHRRIWVMTPAIVHADNLNVYGFDIAGTRKRDGNRSSQILFGYSSIDPEGAVGPFDHARLRYRNKFAELSSGWAFEGQAQLAERRERFFEQSAQLNASYRPLESLAFAVNAGYIWRDRDNASTLKDRDIRIGVQQKLAVAGGLQIAADYRLENEVTGEDDFSVGVAFGKGWYVSAGKHWVTTLSFVLPLNGG